MYRPVHSAAAFKCRIRGIDDDIDLFYGDVANADKYSSSLEGVNSLKIHWVYILWWDAR